MFKSPKQRGFYFAQQKDDQTGQIQPMKIAKPKFKNINTEMEQHIKMHQNPQVDIEKPQKFINLRKMIFGKGR